MKTKDCWRQSGSGRDHDSFPNVIALERNYLTGAYETRRPRPAIRVAIAAVTGSLRTRSMTSKLSLPLAAKRGPATFSMAVLNRAINASGVSGVEKKIRCSVASGKGDRARCKIHMHATLPEPI